MNKFIEDYKKTPTYSGSLFYPGEKSFNMRKENIKSGSIYVDSDILNQIITF